MKFWLLISLLFAVLMLPALALADDTVARTVDPSTPAPDEYVGNSINYTLEQPFGGVSSVASFAAYLQLVYQFGLGIIGIIATVLIMFGGVKWISATGNESIIGDAKEIIIAAVTGLTIALLSYIILLIINPKLINISLNILKIPVAANNTAVSCTNDKPLTEPTGAKFCHGHGTTAVSATDLNNLITNDDANSGMSLTFIKAIMKSESSFCIDAQSNIWNKSKTVITKHACGIIQVIPSTAKTNMTGCNVPDCAKVTTGLWVNDPDHYDPAKPTENTQYKADPYAPTCCNEIEASAENGICVGVNYLKYLYKDPLTKGDETLMAAGYNGGDGAITPSSKCSGLVYQCDTADYSETQKYVVTVATNKAAICAANTGGGCVTDATTGHANNAYCKTTVLGADTYSYATCTDSVPVCTSPAIMVNPGTCGTAGNHYALSGSTSTTTPSCVANPSSFSTTGSKL